MTHPSSLNGKDVSNKEKLVWANNYASSAGKNIA